MRQRRSGRHPHPFNGYVGATAHQAAGRLASDTLYGAILSTAPDKCPAGTDEEVADAIKRLHKVKGHENYLWNAISQYRDLLEDWLQEMMAFGRVIREGLDLEHTMLLDQLSADRSSNTKRSRVGEKDEAPVPEQLADGWESRCDGKVLCTPDCSQLAWLGKEYQLSEQQAAVLNHMTKMWGKVREFRRKALLELNGVSSENLRDIFRSGNNPHPLWGTLLIPVDGKRGMYTLQPDLPALPSRPAPGAGRAAAPRKSKKSPRSAP